MFSKFTDKSDDFPEVEEIISAILLQFAVMLKNAVRQAILTDRARAMAEEVAQWEPCYGDSAPADPKIRHDRILRAASTRYVLALLNMPSDKED